LKRNAGRTAAFVAVILLILAVPAPAGARPSGSRLGAAVSPLRLVPLGPEPIFMRGLHSYLGTIELTSFGDGLAVSNTLSLERYLLGLNEVPLDWPTEALRAQVVAARTYALWTLAGPRGGTAAVYDFDICATVQCQVFSGADVVRTTDGVRWRQAVADTRGQTLFYFGAPILARYHSTSGGHTLDNAQAFPSEPNYPYLQSVSSTSETASPLYRWKVRFRLADLKAMLVRAGWWDAGRLLEVRTIPSRAGLHYPDILFRGSDGRFVRSAEELRTILRELAPQMFPGKYPSPAPTTSGLLPETFPSNRIVVRTNERSVLVIGAGWGHGVGMSQWGAHGLAMRGSSYMDILGHYYSGVSLETIPVRRSIKVGLDTGNRVVTASGEFRIVNGRNRVLVKRALGTWTFRWAGSGAVAVRPPRGFGLPLDVGIVRAPATAEVGDRVPITIALSRPARVQVVTGGTEGEKPSTKVENAGRTRVVWRAPESPGVYAVRVHASTGGRARRSEPVEIEVRAPVDDPFGPLDASEREDESTQWWLLVLALALVTFAVTAAVLGRIRR
jgi:stage II sporulation protein D